jgi:hypothetical protein
MSQFSTHLYYIRISAEKFYPHETLSTPVKILLSFFRKYNAMSAYLMPIKLYKTLTDYGCVYFL